jgi:hypothetical protein
MRNPRRLGGKVKCNRWQLQAVLLTDSGCWMRGESGRTLLLTFQRAWIARKRLVADTHIHYQL